MKTYAIVGSGARARGMFVIPLHRDWQGKARLVGIYDVNPIRAKLVSQECGDVPVYRSFEEMIEAGRPDTVIVASPDHTHHEYIIRALQAGCDVISEKPVTIDMDRCREIVEAEKASGKKVTVTFNCRFMPYVVRIKELLDQKSVGNIRHVELQWMLDTRHGAEYFRRWHRRMENSGGLLVHKSTHHFDMVNWWISDRPKTVQAFGARNVYGPTRQERGVRCMDCAHQSSCEFYYDLKADEFNSRFYLQAEHEDGYVRDRCVFSEEIDIYDTMSLNVKYEGGALLNYSLVAYSPFEGWKLTVHGDRGRLEAAEYHSGQRHADPFRTIEVYPHGGEQITYRIENHRETHGGGDSRLREMLFGDGRDDRLGQMADLQEGAMSLVIGAAANVSAAEERVLRVEELWDGRDGG